MNKCLSSFVLLSAFSLVLTACSKKLQPAKTVMNNGAAVHFLLGNPSNARADTTRYLNYLMVKPQYVLSYNRERCTPNWVSWHLDKSWLGTAPRQNDFREDTTLPSGWYHVQAGDYSGSGFDRGHNCPSGDRTSSIEDNSATFLMTNMVPQAPKNNRQTWERLESYCRTLVDEGNELYIIMGSYGMGGIGSTGNKSTIAEGRITVPANIWKVVVVLPEGSDDRSRINSSTRIIAVNTPNINTITTSWQTYRTTVDKIEAATGLNLLSDLPKKIQRVIEAKVDTVTIQ